MRNPRWFHLLLATLPLQLSILAPVWAQDELSFIRHDFAVGFRPSSIAVADFNGDGRLDLATADQAGSVSILFGNGDGTFEPALISDIEQVLPVSLAVGDFNGDGQQDLA